MAKPLELSSNKTTFVLPDILTRKNGTSVVSMPRRLVFAHGTTAHDDLVPLNAKKGTELKVLGIPRVNLDILMDEANKNPGQTTTVQGAYEMIVVGIK